MVLWIVYIEPTIGHMKTDGKLDRNWLKGALGFVIPHNFLNEINMTRENRP